MISQSFIIIQDPVQALWKHSGILLYADVLIRRKKDIFLDNCFFVAYYA